jgi:hypothetical protein
MITSYTVGSVFKIIDEASPALRLILAEVRKLNLALENARTNLATFGKSPVGLTAAIGETSALAKAWKDVAANARLAQGAIGSASKVAARAALPATAAAVATGESAAAAAAATGGRPPRGRAPSWPGRSGGGGGGAHFYSPSIGLPGGSHMRFRGPAMVGAGALGWGVDQAAQTEKYAYQLAYHAHLDTKSPAVLAKFRKVLQDAQIDSGFSIKEVGEAALDAVRQFQGVPGGGIDALPEILHAGATEAMSKGAGLKESVASFIGFAHMFRSYSPEAILKLAPTFAAYSTADPRSLTSIKNAASYALPILQTLDVDPTGALGLGTALARAGVGSTKSGTWIRESVVRAMPGVVLGHKASNKKHEEALRALGLVDEQGKPTWFTEGRPDPLKMYGIAGEHLKGMTPQDRAVYSRAAFGAQGANAVAIMSDPRVQEQLANIENIRKSPEFQTAYKDFGKNYMEGSTIQDARVALQQFNVTMGELARMTLPSINVALGGFKSALEGIRSVLPAGVDGKGAATIGGHAIVGAALGAVAGSIIPGAGTLGGAVIGGVIGGAEGVAEQYMKNQQEQDRKAGGRLEQMYAPRLRLGGAPDAAPKVTLSPSIALSLNIDGRQLAESVSTALATLNALPTQAPAADGMGQFYGGDHNYPDK